MKITLSKSQWEFIGNKTGWIKTAQVLQETPVLHPKLPLEDSSRLPKWVKNIIAELKTFATVFKVSYNVAIRNVFIEFLPLTHSMKENELKKLYEICGKYNGEFSTINDRSILLFRG